MKTSALLLSVAVAAAAFTPALADESARAVKAEAVPSPAAAAVVAAPGQVAAPAAQPRKICRREGITGSRTVGTRLCLTKEQWRQIARGEDVTITRERVPNRR